MEMTKCFHDFRITPRQEGRFGIMQCDSCLGTVLLIRQADGQWKRYEPESDTDIRELLGPNIRPGSFLLRQKEGK